MKNYSIPTFYMMVGLPGSGKSTESERIRKACQIAGQNCHVISSDSIRGELTGNEKCFDKDGEVFELMRTRSIDFLKKGESVVYDATNMSSKRRKALLCSFPKGNYKKVCILVATPAEECVKNNELRSRGGGRYVPTNAIFSLMKSFRTPVRNEGWDDIVLYFNKEEYKNMYGNPGKIISNYANFNQENPNHAESLGEHIQYVVNNLQNSSEILKYAALLHDCGKPETKTFKNHKGEIEEVAHYYNHENVGSYKSLFYDYPEEMKLNVSSLISYHMDHYGWKEPKDGEKIKSLLGDELFSLLEDLGQADEKGSILVKTLEQEGDEIIL